MTLTDRKHDGLRLLSNLTPPATSDHGPEVVPQVDQYMSSTVPKIKSRYIDKLQYLSTPLFQAFSKERTYLSKILLQESLTTNGTSVIPISNDWIIKTKKRLPMHTACQIITLTPTHKPTAKPLSSIFTVQTRSEGARIIRPFHGKIIHSMGKLVITNLFCFLGFLTSPITTWAQGGDSHPLPPSTPPPPQPILYLKNTDSIAVRVRYARKTWVLGPMEMSKGFEVSAIPKNGSYAIYKKMEGKKKDSLLFDAPDAQQYIAGMGHYVGVVFHNNDSNRWQIHLRAWDPKEDGTMPANDPSWKSTRQGRRVAALATQIQREQIRMAMIDPHITPGIKGGANATPGEQIVVLTDKVVAYPGDTLWFSASVLSGPYPASSTLHVELLEKDTLITAKFRCRHGLSIGQLRCPDTPGNYWVRFYTLNSEGKVLALTVRPRGPEYIRYHFPADSTLQLLFGGLLLVSHDSVGYFIKKIHPDLQYYTAVISDTGQPAHLSKFKTVPQGPYRADTNLLSFRYSILSKRRVTGENLNIVYQQDDSLHKDLYPVIDSTETMTLKNIEFDGGKAYFSYQLNQGHRDDVTLLQEEDRPPFVEPTGYISDSIKQKYIYLKGYAQAKVLDTVSVHPNYQHRFDRLEEKYIKGTGFEGVAHYKYSLMDSTVRDTTEDVMTYLHDQQPFIFPVDILTGKMRFKQRMKWYVDGQESLYEYVRGIPANRIAYFKCLEDQTDGEMGYYSKMTVWLRKGEDARNIPTQMKYINLRGYTPVKPWTTPDRSTFKWIPYSAGEKIYLGVKPPFQVEILAFYKGYPWYMTMQIDE